MNVFKDPHSTRQWDKHLIRVIAFILIIYLNALKKIVYSLLYFFHSIKRTISVLFIKHEYPEIFIIHSYVLRA